MHVKKGDLWESDADLIAVTTCGSINGSSRHLAMGMGAAFQASRRYPRLPAAAARCIEEEMLCQIGQVPVYGFIVVRVDKTTCIGLFQSKLQPGDRSPLSLIGTSAMCLMAWLERNPRKRVAINFPGIGLGKLPRGLVEPILTDLPDSVTFHIL